jgi:hypothetical protein
VQEILLGKVDVHSMKQNLEMKASQSEVEGLKNTLDRVYKEIDEKADAKDIESHIIFTKNAFEEINKELLLKTNIKDLCQLLDQKASTDDVNSTLNAIQKEIELKPQAIDLKKALQEQSLINEALCAENCVGRWIWKSGELKNMAVPWEVQSINSCPDNFLWEKQKTSILCAAPGLYELRFGFYSKIMPTVTVHVNGEPILTANQTVSQVSSKKF